MGRTRLARQHGLSGTQPRTEIQPPDTRGRRTDCNRMSINLRALRARLPQNYQIQTIRTGSTTPVTATDNSYRAAKQVLRLRPLSRTPLGTKSRVRNNRQEPPTNSPYPRQPSTHRRIGIDRTNRLDRAADPRDRTSPLALRQLPTVYRRLSRARIRTATMGRTQMYRLHNTQMYRLSGCLSNQHIPNRHY